jgi:hypothetical protein
MEFLTMDQVFDIHVSTVAFSAYNWLAGRAAPAAEGQVLAGLKEAWDPRCTAEAVREALGELVARKRVTQSGLLFALRDPRRRVAISRDRDGDPWSWRVSAKPVARSESLDAVLLGVSQ